MSSMIQIRNVPVELHRAAKAKAALAGLTLSEYALQALAREVARPTVAEIAARIRLLEPLDEAPPAEELVASGRDDARS
jgi:antitoxin FitA